MIKHIFADMDGTLLDENGEVTPATVAAIKQTGLPVTLVSARAPLEMAPAIQALELTEPQIAFNGGLIYQRTATGWRYISERPIVKSVARTVIDALAVHFPALSVSYYDRTNWYAPKGDQGTAFEAHLTNQSLTVTATDEVFARADSAIFKIMMITFDAAEMVAVSQYLRALQLPGISIQQSGAAYLEITSDEAKKSRGIDYILEREHLEKADTAGFGDGHNDLPMFDRVGTAIVMGNALDEIKRVATHVTRANTDDGIAYALTHYQEFLAR